MQSGLKNSISGDIIKDHNLLQTLTRVNRPYESSDMVLLWILLIFEKNLTHQ